MRRLKNYAAAALAFIVICVILLSVAAVVLEATHDCEGAECPVCEFSHPIHYAGDRKGKTEELIPFL